MDYMDLAVCYLERPLILSTHSLTWQAITWTSDDSFHTYVCLQVFVNSAMLEYSEHWFKSYSKWQHSFQMKAVLPLAKKLMFAAT